MKGNRFNFKISEVVDVEENTNIISKVTYYTQYHHGQHGIMKTCSIFSPDYKDVSL